MTAEQFRSELEAFLIEARSQGRSSIEVSAGELHRRLGGYPGPNHSMPVCCSVMKAVAATCRHEIVYAPPSGKGASFRIRFHLNADSSPFAGTRCAAEQHSHASGVPSISVPPRQRNQEQHEINLLVVGSCTGEKKIADCPCLLTSVGLAQNVWRERLTPWELPAAELYSGPQHVKMMNGVNTLRGQFGKTSCEVAIISAGYGLVSERQRLVPYEYTFSGLKPREIARVADTLEIPRNLRSAVREFPLVVFLLGKEYLRSTGPHLRPESGQRFLFFSSEDAAELIAREATVAYAGKPEALKYGASTLSLKGRMFQLLAEGLASHPAMWKDLLNDETPATATCLMESALEAHR